MRANNALIKRYENSFLKQEIDYLTNFQHESSNFYSLPKIDKFKTISKAIEEQNPEYILCFQPKDLKLGLNNFGDIILKSLLFKIKSYVTDVIDFLKKMQEKINKKFKTL